MLIAQVSFSQIYRMNIGRVNTTRKNTVRILASFVHIFILISNFLNIYIYPFLPLTERSCHLSLFVIFRSPNSGIVFSYVRCNCIARRFSILNMPKTQAESLLMEHSMCFLFFVLLYFVNILIYILLWPHGRWVNSKGCSFTVVFCYYLKRDFHPRYLMNILIKCTVQLVPCIWSITSCEENLLWYPDTVCLISLPLVAAT